MTYAANVSPLSLDASDFRRLTGSPSAFDPVAWKLSQGLSATVQVWGDSTTIDSGPRRWVGQWADALVAAGKLPAGCGCRIYQWVGNFYAAANIETIAASATGQWLEIYLGGVSGAQPSYFQGPLFVRALASVSADCLIFACTINIATHGGLFADEIVAAIEQYRTANPQAAILALTQHPNRDNAVLYDGPRNALKALAGPLGISVNDDVYQAFLAAGRPVDWYVAGDPVHESTTLGCLPYIAVMMAEWDRAVPVYPAPRRSRFDMAAGAQQFLTNGDFATWTNTSAIPDGWASAGTIAFSKDTAIYADPRKPFSVRMLSSGATATWLGQTLTGTQFNNLGGKTVSFAARFRKDTAGAGTIGRLNLTWTGGTSPGQKTEVANLIQQDGFQWHVLTQTLPSDATGLTARLYVDNVSPPDASYGVWVDQMSLTPTALPLAFR